MADSPLSGVRVLDFTWAWAGPFCTQTLAHLGAEVIRIECTLRPCVTRMIPPFADNQPGPNRAGYFNQYNQGKRSILLDLSKPEAVKLAFQLAKHCDVVADNFAAGVIDKLGFSYEKLREIKPDIIQISMSGYGQYGPFKRYVGYGPPASALSGQFWLTGYPGGDPAEIGVSYPDPNAGVMGAYAIIAALLHRDLTGEGQYIDQSQWEAVLVHMAEGLLEWDINHREPARNGNHDRLMAPRLGKLDAKAFAEKGAREILGYKTEPWTLKQAQILNFNHEIDDDLGDYLLPRTMHPAIPAYATFTVIVCPESPVGAFSLGEVKITARAGVRPRDFVLRKILPDVATRAANSPSAGAIRPCPRATQAYRAPRPRHSERRRRGPHDPGNGYARPQHNLWQRHPVHREHAPRTQQRGRPACIVPGESGLRVLAR